jgi:hypothetical protein
MRKRPNGEGTIFEDKKSKRFRGQYFDADHKRRTVSARTYDEAYQKLRKAISARDAGTMQKQRDQHLLPPE